MKVGDLVSYRKLDLVGIVLEVEKDPARANWMPYRVRWVDHNSSQRDWYSKDELFFLTSSVKSDIV